MKKNILILTTSILFIACAERQVAQNIIDQSIVAHGLNRLQGMSVSFVFRDKTYEVIRIGDKVIYSRIFKTDSSEVKDILVNSTDFCRLEDGDTVNLTEEWKKRYSASVNSVLYFFQVPLVLNDPAAKKRHVGKAMIGSEQYYAIKVWFQEQNGGEDYDDEFVYWINTETLLVDFFAYSYLTEGGGVRFREATERVDRSGMKFQNYVNYKADLGTKLTDLPSLYDQGALEKLSVIENEKILVKGLN
ncbi:MAG: DUF6503 family protein [Cyclobacteriaceae bacterium]